MWFFFKDIALGKTLHSEIFSSRQAINRTAYICKNCDAWLHSPVTQTTPQSTLLTWGGWLCQFNPHPHPHPPLATFPKPVFVALIMLLRPTSAYYPYDLEMCQCARVWCLTRPHNFKIKHIPHMHMVCCVLGWPVTSRFNQSILSKLLRPHCDYRTMVPVPLPQCPWKPPWKVWVNVSYEYPHNCPVVQFNSKPCCPKCAVIIFSISCVAHRVTNREETVRCHYNKFNFLQDDSR